MPTLNASSQARLKLAHPLLRQLFAACASDPACPPFAVLDSQRGKQAQEKAFSLGHSRAHFGQSAHNWAPAVAVDVVPYPIDWNNLARFKALGAFVTAKARTLGIDVTWGASFAKLKDYPHYELSNWRDLVAAKKVRPFDG
jgi:peptidoglycan L-alanyl-D-glutamate endopeptidase CwlK